MGNTEWRPIKDGTISCNRSSSGGVKGDNTVQHMEKCRSAVSKWIQALDLTRVVPLFPLSLLGHDGDWNNKDREPALPIGDPEGTVKDTLVKLLQRHSVAVPSHEKTGTKLVQRIFLAKTLIQWYSIFRFNPVECPSQSTSYFLPQITLRIHISVSIRAREQFVLIANRAVINMNRDKIRGYIFVRNKYKLLLDDLSLWMLFIIFYTHS